MPRLMQPDTYPTHLLASKVPCRTSVSELQVPSCSRSCLLQISSLSIRVAPQNHVLQAARGAGASSLFVLGLLSELFVVGTENIR
jgi:hypothetical protein